MYALTNGWFELELDSDGLLRTLTLPWMKAPEEGPVQLLESYGPIFVDDEMFLPHNALQPAIDDLLKGSPALKDLIGSRAPDTTVHVLAPARIGGANDAHTIEYSTNDVQIERIVGAHSVYPVPTVTHRVTNHGRRSIEVNYYWCVGTDGGRYGVLSEKGDMVPPMLQMLGGQCAVYFINMLQALRTGNPLLNWAYINLNFGRLQPGETKSFRVNLWTVKHLWVGTQFSGYGFALSDQDSTAAVAAASAASGRYADGGSWLLDRLYTPIFIFNGNTVSEETRDLLRRAPIRLLLTNVQLDGQSLAFCHQRGIRLVYFPGLDPDPFVAVQQALDKALGYDGVERQSHGYYECPKIVNVLPEGLDQQLLLGHYYSLRRDTAKIGDRFTVPARNVFIQARSLPNQRYVALLQSAAFVRILGTQNAVGSGIEQWLTQFGRTTRHSFDSSPDSPDGVQEILASRGLPLGTERIASDSMMSRLVSFFANHDYALTRMAVESLCDPKHAPSAAFSAAIEQATGQRGFWNVSLELIQEYGKLEIFGPVFSVIVPTSEWGDSEIFNAVLGAQYAKALRACLLPLHCLPETNQRTVRHAFKELRDQVYDLNQNRVGWHKIEGNLKVISSELMSCFDTLTKILLRAGEFAREVRATYGQRGVYLFHSDYSLPIELVSRHEAFGRSNTLGTLTLFSRMAFKSPPQTALYGAESVLYQQSWYPSTTQVVLASDPAGDLLGSSVLEHPSVSIALGRIGVTPKLLIGLNKKLVLPDVTVKLLPMPDAGSFHVVESTKDEHGNIIDEEVYEFDPPQDCTVENFVAAISASGGVHFTGHGEVHQRSPELVLADGNLSFDEFPHLDGHPWLMLNACELGQASDRAESAMQLLSQGAIQVIAPLLAVKDAAVSELGMLYGFLPIMSLPAAFQFMRHNLFLGGGQSTEHLAYVVYGDPFAYQGRKLWEAYDAYYCYVVGWQQADVKEKYHLYDQETHLYRLVSKEAQLRADATGGRYWRDQAEFFSERAEASSGAFYALIADTLPSSQQRLGYLAKAMEAYLSAAAKKTESDFNRTLMYAYGLQAFATLQIESVALSFLTRQLTTDQLRKDFLEAVGHLHKTEAEFRKIGARDANHCVVLRETLQRIVQMAAGESSRPQLESVLRALLHTPEGELAQNPPPALRLELAEGKRASATAKQAGRSEPQSASSPVSLRGFFSAGSFKHNDVAVFLGEFVDSLQFLAEMYSKLHHGQLAPSDVLELIDATSRLDISRDRPQILVNNALLKRTTKHWLYDDSNFQRRFSKELHAKFIGFSILLALLDIRMFEIPIIRDYAQTYLDLFWEGEQRLYVALEEGRRLSIKQVDEITGRVTTLKIDRNGQLEISAGPGNLYKVRASVDAWADLYICMLFEERFRIPASQRYRVGQTELSMRFGIGGIVDIGSIALLVRGQSEDFFFRELEKQLTEYLAPRIDGKSFTHRMDALVALQRSRSSAGFIALADALVDLGVSDESWGVLQSRGIVISMFSTKEQELQLARRLDEASDSVLQLIRQRFR